MDINTLQTYLQGKGSSLVLAASDAALPPELQAFLATVPGKQLTLACGQEGIAQSGSQLTVSGSCQDTWPVQGLGAVVLTLSAGQLVIDATSSPAVCSATVQATMPFAAGINAAVTVTSLQQANSPWQITLRADVPGLTPMQALLLGKAGGLPFILPPGMDFLSSELEIDKNKYSILFYPNTTYEAYTTFTLVAPAAVWKPVPALFSFNGLDITAVLATNSTAVTITGHLVIATTPLDVSIGLSSGPIWQVATRPTAPSTAFPGLAALAQWVGAGDAAGSFANVNLSTSGFDAAISSVSAQVNVVTPALVSLTVASVLTLGALQLDVLLSLPGFTIRGGLHGQNPLKVSDLLTSQGLSASAVPAALTISTADFVADLSGGSYSLDLVVYNAWTIGPLALEELGLLLAYGPGSGLAGTFSGQFGLGTAANVLLTAGYDSENGWEFEGGLDPSTPAAIGDVLTLLASDFGIGSVPEPLKSLTLKALDVSYKTGTGAFVFTCAGTFSVDDTAVLLSVDICLTRSGQDGQGTVAQPGHVSGTKGYDAFFSGSLTVNKLEFDVVFDTTTAGADGQGTGAQAAAAGINTFIATYQHTAKGSINLQDMVAAVSTAVAAEVPADIELDLQQAKFVFFSQTPAGTTPAPSATKQFLFAFELGTSFSLADIPVVGSKLPASLSAGVNNLQVLYCSRAFDKDAVGTINNLFPTGIYPLPADGTATGLTVLADLELGDVTKHLTLGGAAASAAQAPTASTGLAPAAATATASGTPATALTAPAAAPPPTIKWIDVQKQLGPVQFQRIGISYAAGVLLFALDAAVTLGPVSFAAQGLSFGSPLSSFAPQFDLQGLSIGYASSALTIEGAILKVPAAELAPGVSLQYDGALIVQAEQWGLTALASYAQLADGMPSLFVFLDVNATLGGPPFFLVQGLMGGFGFNRSLVLPTFDQMQHFPLLAIGGPATGSARDQAMAVLTNLEGNHGTTTAWLAPKQGDYWLAAGLKFSSFELVQGELLLVAEFGHDLQFAVLGLAWLSLPQDPVTEKFVYVELQMEAVLQPSQGFFGAAASLTSSSFVLTPDCHLTGGFAFNLWYGPSPNAGQFVLTAGGYHPAFQAPAYYPQVARLGFNWPVSSEVTIKGGSYFAITPACGMAGGSLEALYQSGNIRAWFTAYANFLVTWHPFSFAADMEIEIGASVRVNLLVCHKTISASVSASLTLWGPPLGGTVRVHVVVVTVTIGFGASPVGLNQQPLAWADFKALLPALPDVCKLTANRGLSQTLQRDTVTNQLVLSQQAPAHATRPVWVVRAGRFGFTAQSSVPAGRLTYGATCAKGSPAPSGYGKNVGGGTIAIRPMNRPAVDSVLDLCIAAGSATSPPLDVSNWTLTPVYGNMAATLWGAPLHDGAGNFVQSPATPSADLVPHQLMGYCVLAPDPVAGATFGLVALAQLDVEYIQFYPNQDHTQNPQDPQSPLALVPPAATDYLPGTSTTGLTDLTQVADLAPQRTELYAVLRAANLYAGPNDALLGLATRAGSLYVASPLELL